MNGLTYLEIHDKLEGVWSRGPCRINWLEFEQLLADILNSDRINELQRVAACKECLDAYTRRGHFHPKEYEI